MANKQKSSYVPPLYHHIEQIADKIMGKVEHDLLNSGLTEEEQRKVAKEVLAYLFLFAITKGEKNEK